MMVTSEAINEQPYNDLTPDVVLAAVESLDFVCDGHLLALNSYENRVYQVGIEEAQPLIAKFYRPQRWTDEAILEEHAFAAELAEQEVPLVAPLSLDGQTLFEHQGYRFSLTPRCGGRAAELDQDEVLEWLGRFLGRLHNVGRVKPFAHRPELTVQRYGWDSREYLLHNNWIPAHIETAFAGMTDEVLQQVDQMFSVTADCQRLRLHGDFHPGNILWRDGPFFVDLDDCQSGPAVQDLWLLLAGDEIQMAAQCRTVLKGYHLFADFDRRELQLIEPLRTLRILHHAAWLARRWNDPAFPHTFTWFDTTRYWEELVLSLREQSAALQAPAIVID